MGVQYTTNDYYKVSLLHAIVSVLGLVFASLGCAFTADRVHIHVNDEQREEGKEEQSAVPYWVSGFVLGGLNILLFLLSFHVYRLVTKGTYTEARKECAKERDAQYRFVLIFATIWGIAGAVFTGIFGISKCSYESAETCYYVYTNFAANNGFTITLIVIHSIWFLVVLDLWSSIKGIQNQVGSIPVGKTFDKPTTTTAPNVTSPHSQTTNGASGSTRTPAVIRSTGTPVAPPPSQPSRSNSASQPPSYDAAISSPYVINYPDPPPSYTAGSNTQPQNVYSGSALPDIAPTATAPTAARTS